MNGIRVAVDTTTAVHYLNNVEAVRRRLEAEPSIALPVAVAAELLFGALNSGRSAVNLPRYQALIDSAVVLPADPSTAMEYARLRLALKQLGRPIPSNDLWIAATCIQHNLTLVTSDRHFSACVDLLTEDWTR